MKKMYETKEPAFIAALESLSNEAADNVIKALQGTEKARNAYFHSEKHADLSAATLGRLVMSYMAHPATVSAKDVHEAWIVAKSFAASAKEAHLSANKTAKLVAHMSSLSANDSAKIAAFAKAWWEGAEGYAANARIVAVLASKI
jgi:hypothetical protein